MAFSPEGSGRPLYPINIFMRGLQEKENILQCRRNIRVQGNYVAGVDDFQKAIFDNFSGSDDLFF